MPKNDGEVQEARAEQSRNSKRATFDALKSKSRAKTEVEFSFETDDGKQDVTLEFRAIGAIAYDKLVTKYPPTTEQKAEGNPYNIHKFGPALLTEVCVDPALSLEEWTEIWNSPAWNRGEIVDLFATALNLCNKGLEAPPTKSV